jgi:hypothetical protein
MNIILLTADDPTPLLDALDALGHQTRVGVTAGDLFRPDVVVARFPLTTAQLFLLGVARGASRRMILIDPREPSGRDVPAIVHVAAARVVPTPAEAFAVLARWDAELRALRGEVAP